MEKRRQKDKETQRGWRLSFHHAVMARVCARHMAWCLTTASTISFHRDHST